MSILDNMDTSPLATIFADDSSISAPDCNVKCIVPNTFCVVNPTDIFAMVITVS